MRIKPYVTDNGNIIGFPKFNRVIELLFLPYRGLFISSPVLLMCFPGIMLALKRKKWISEILVCMGVFFVFLMINAGFSGWFGGFTVGPRYLLPAFPFIFFLTIFSFKKYKKYFVVLGIVSIIINLSITVVGIEVSYNIKNPLTQVVFKNMIQGNVSINPIPISNLQNHPRLDKLINLDNFQNNISFNLGELFFPHHILSILPLILFWFACWAAIRHWCLGKPTKLFN